MFRNKFNAREVDKYFTNPGSPIKVVRAGKLDKSNNIEVVEKGTENLYAYINSFAQSVDINVIMTKFLNGDKEILLQRAGAYLDISSLPRSFQEMVDIRLNAENLFKTLPIEVKQKFDNNVNQFISNMGSKEWMEIMDTSQDKIFKEKRQSSDQVTKQLKDQVQHAEVLENPAIDEPFVQEGDIK